jgi:hypothetical protein
VKWLDLSLPNTMFFVGQRQCNKGIDYQCFMFFFAGQGTFLRGY